MPKTLQQERDFAKDPSIYSERKLIGNLLAYVRMFPGLVAVGLGLLIISDLANTIYPIILKNGIDNHITPGNIQGLKYTALLLGGVMLAGFLLTTVMNIVINLLGQKIIHTLRLDVLRKVTQMTNSYFDKTPTGRNLTYLTTDIEAVRQFISDGVISILADLIKIVFILGFMISINGTLTLFTLSVSLPLFILGTYFFRISIRKGYRGVRRANSLMSTFLVESLAGIKEILLFNHRQKSIEDFDGANTTYLKSFMKVVHSYSIYFPLIEVVTSVSMIAMLLYAHYTLGVSVTIGEIFAFFIYINLFFRPLLHLAEQFNALQSAVAACERIFSFLGLKPSFESAVPYTPAPPVSGAIRFENVSFAYDEGVPVLKNVSFSINAGEKVAIVGSTGSGKTTIISLLNRLYDINSGKILIDGRDIREMSLQELRENVGTIPQDIFLFTGTFHENISLYKKGCSEEEVKIAAKRALLDPIIMKHPKGYHQNVLEEGKSLSTGQKQLLSFARTFAQAPPIVILDEATANIDSESEKLIESALDELLVDKTAIIIAHRLSTISRADRIIVMRHGELMDMGTHQELLKKSSIYQKFHSLQEIQLSI